jgi:VWFA-related protein
MNAIALTPVELPLRLLPKFCTAAALFIVASNGILTQGISSQQLTANTVTVIVTVTGRGNAPPSLGVSDVTVRQDGKIRAVLSCEPASSSQPLDLAILIDNALARNRVNRWDELQAFLRDQPAGTRETIANANSKIIKIAQTATTDHTLAANAVVNPTVESAPADAMYESVGQLIDTWPSGSGRRVLLFVTRGFPRDYANSGIKAESSWPLQKLIQDAQRKGIVIYTIHSTPALANDPNALSRLSAETGGKAFATGMERGPSLRTFLREIRHRLEHQYSISFCAEPSAKSHFAVLRITTKLQSAEIRYPARIYVPAK